MMPAPKGKVVNFKPLEEEFSYFSLSDGMVIGVKVSLVKVSRLQNPDGSDAFSSDGMPAYYFSAQNVTQVLTRAEYNGMVISRRRR